MNSLSIPERSIDIEIPAHWDEMNDGQRRYCLTQAVFASLGIITPTEAKVRCLYYLLEIKRDHQSIAKERMWPAERVMEKNSRIFLLCEELITFLFRKNDKDQMEINYDTIMNHFPEVKAGKKKLFGPGHLLADITFGEFRAALEEMGEYFETREQESLSRMIACLYRPERAEYETLCKAEDFDGMRREPFNRARIEENAVYASKLPAVIRMAILLWFTYTIDYIQKEDLVLGGREVNFSLIFTGGEGSGQRDNSGWTGVLYTIAEKGTFGNIQATDRAGLLDLLLYMYDKEIENRKIKARAKRK